MLQANRSAELMFYYEKGTMQGLYIHQLINEFSLEYYLLNNQISGQEKPSVMERMVGKDQRGGVLDLEMAINMDKAGGEIFYSISLVDIKHHLAQQEELAKLAHTDPLTGLMNRRHFRLLVDQEFSCATLIAERIRQQVSQIKLPKIPEGLTISIGLCEAKPGMELKAAISLADQALYQAKTDGRNRVVCFE